MSSRDERAAINCLVGASAMLDASSWFIRSWIALVMYALLESLYDNTWSSRVTIDPGSAIEIGIALSADRRRLNKDTSMLQDPVDLLNLIIHSLYNRHISRRRWPQFASLCRLQVMKDVVTVMFVAFHQRFESVIGMPSPKLSALSPHK